MTDKTREALQRFLVFLLENLKDKPGTLAEARSLFNEYIFHSFSDVRNESMQEVDGVLATTRVT